MEGQCIELFGSPGVLMCSYHFYHTVIGTLRCISSWPLSCEIGSTDGDHYEVVLIVR